MSVLIIQLDGYMAVRNLSRHWRNQFVQGVAIVFAGTMGVNLLNYLFTLIMGRMLEPVAYSTVVTLFGLLMIVSVTSTALVSFMAHYSALLESRQALALLRRFFWKVFGTTAVVGLMIMLVWMAMTPLVGNFFGIEYSSIILFSFLLPVSLLIAAVRGVFQGRQQFSVFSLSSILGAVGKLILAVIFVLIGLSVSGVLLALVISSVLTLGYCLWQVRGLLPVTTIHQTTRPVAFERSSFVRFFSTAFWAALLFSLYVNIDMILVKHYFSPEQAGQYAAISILGNLVVFGVTAFTTVMFPLVSGSPGSGRQYLKMSLGATSLLGIPILLVFGFFPAWVVRFTLGQRYISVAPYLLPYGGGFLLGALGMVFVYYFLASRDRWFVYPLCVVIITQIAAIITWHGSIRQVTTTMLLTGVLFLVSMAGRYALLPDTPKAEMKTKTDSKPSYL